MAQAQNLKTVFSLHYNPILELSNPNRHEIVVC